MKTAKQHNAPMVGEVKINHEHESRVNEHIAKIGGAGANEHLLQAILSELRAIREQLKTEVVTRDKFR